MRFDPGQQFQIGMIREGATRMTCVEAHCANERAGWVTVLDPTTEKHANAARWIEGNSGREFVKLASVSALDWLEAHGHERGITVTPALRQTLERTPPGMLVFLFPPGQQCFRFHADREVVFVHKRPRATPYVHVNPLDFNEDMNETADRIGVLRKREGIDEIKQEMGKVG